MTAISRVVEGGPAILLAHVFVTAQGPEIVEFEVLEANSASLHEHVGIKQFLACGSTDSFWGELVYLGPCIPTAPGLALMKDRPALKGVLKVYSGESSALQ